MSPKKAAATAASTTTTADKAANTTPVVVRSKYAIRLMFLFHFTQSFFLYFKVEEAALRRPLWLQKQRQRLTLTQRREKGMCIILTHLPSLTYILLSSVEIESEDEQRYFLSLFFLFYITLTCLFLSSLVYPATPPPSGRRGNQ